MVHARRAALVAASLVALAAVGCGSAGSTHVSRIAIAAPGGASDVGWSQQGVAAAETVARRLRVPARVASGLTAANAAATLERLAQGGPSLLIAHDRAPGTAAAAAAVAARSHVPTLVFGAPRRLRPRLVGDVEVAAEQGGFLAGYIAARASYIPSVGIVVAADDPAWFRTAGGFIAGARAFSPHVRIAYTYAGGGNADAPASQRAAERLIAGRTQMVLGLGDGSTAGVMAATQRALNARGAEHFDAMFVDVIGDKSDTGIKALSGLTAIQWNFAPAYRQALADLRAGRFGTRTYTLDLANGGITLMHDGRTPADNYAAALKLGQEVAAGQVKVPVATTNAQVLALLRGRPGA
ncbi:MAG TPA: BMP family ABC transporter substrate-binding protein [Conexibacter sp.]|nr:BMP family ABC transporter substrate-binding protein [Conexibacter sp.]